MISDRSKFTRESLCSINYHCDSLSGSVIKLFSLHDRPHVPPFIRTGHNAANLQQKASPSDRSPSIWSPNRKVRLSIKLAYHFRNFRIPDRAFGTFPEFLYVSEKKYLAIRSKKIKVRRHRLSNSHFRCTKFVITFSFRWGQNFWSNIPEISKSWKKFFKLIYGRAWKKIFHRYTWKIISVAFLFFFIVSSYKLLKSFLNTCRNSEILFGRHSIDRKSVV